MNRSEVRLTTRFRAIQRLVVCAAIKSKITDEVFCGSRHGDCLNLANRLGLFNGNFEWECGFVDQDNWFMSRAEAWIVADAAGQIRRPTGREGDYVDHRKANIGDDGLLFSENLY
jgi:hypothetical protein